MAGKLPLAEMEVADQIRAIDQMSGEVKRGHPDGPLAQLPEVMSLLGEEGEAQEAVLGLIHSLTRSKPAKQSLFKDPATIIQGCAHQLPAVRGAFASLLVDLPKAGGEGIGSFFASGLAKCAVELISDDDTGVSSKAVECIVQVISAPDGRSALKAHPDLLEALRKQLFGTGANGPVALRVMDLFTQTACSSEEGFQFAKSVGALDAIADAIEEPTADLLMLFNYLEVLNNLATTKMGVEFIGNRPGLPGRVLQLAKTEEIDAVTGFALRFIGSFAKNSAANGEYSIEAGWFGQVLMQLDRTTPTSVAGVRAMESLCDACASPAPLKLLLSPENAKHLSNLRSRLFSTMRDQRELAMHAVAVIFDSSLIADLPDLAEAAFNQIIGDGLPDLLKNRTDPVLEVRVGFLHLLNALSRHRCCAVQLVKDGHFWDWLLDVNAVSDMTGKEYKFGAVQRLLSWSSSLEEVRGAQDVLELRKIAHLGPFAVKGSSPEVQMEVDEP